MDIRRRGLLIEGNQGDESSGSGGNNAPGNRPVFPIVDYSTQYFTLHMLSEGNMTLYKPSSYTSGSLKYSVNDGKWTTFSSNTTLSLVTDDEVRVKCITGAYTRGDKVSMFSGTCDYEVYGNVMSLLYSDDFQEQTELKDTNSFRSLFYGQSKLIDAQNLILNAEILKDYCYHRMFQNCTSLKTLPELPATKLAIYCYANMFQNCTSLNIMPILSATTVKDYSYHAMFLNTAIEEVDSLPATTLGVACYKQMFENCKELRAVKEMLAINLADDCYWSMFRNCSSLTEIPVLPATKLTYQCYRFMFSSCNKLNKITMLATDISAVNCLQNWVEYVASSGTFIKNPNMKSLPRGYSGIPTGWAIQEYNS
jgi:hypothetical protein